MRAFAAALACVPLLGAAPASAIEIGIGVGSGAGRVDRLRSTAAENRIKRQIYQENQQRLRDFDRYMIVRQPPRVVVPPSTSRCLPWTDRGRYAVVCR